MIRGLFGVVAYSPILVLAGVGVYGLWIALGWKFVLAAAWFFSLCAYCVMED